ncbi:MAG: hypothetical protein ACN6RA_03515 [Stenotrophomonas maltophilia]
MPFPTKKRTLASVLARRACSIALLAVTVPLAAACHPLIPAETDSRALSRSAETLEALCGGRCVLVDHAGKPASSCPYGGIAEHTQGFSVLTHGDGKEIVNAAGFIDLSGDYPLLEVHGNGLVEARPDARGDDVAFYSSAGHRVANFETHGEKDRVKVESWAGAPVVTRCMADRCTAFLLGADGQTVAEFAHLDVLDGYDLAAASLDGRHFGLIDRQLRWVGRRDYDAILAGTPLLARRNGGLTVLDADGRELIPLGDYSGVGSIDTGTLTAVLSGSGDCLYFTPQGEPLPTRTKACLLRGDATVGYYIFGDDTSAYIGNEQGEPLSPKVDGLLLPLNSQAVAHITPDSDGRMGTVSPQGVPQLSTRYSELTAFRERASGTVFRDDLLVASVEEGTGLMDLEGRWRIEPRYVEVGPVSRTLVYVREEDGKLQLFNTDGKPIGATHFIRPQRAALLDGSHGIVASTKGHMGVLDEEGRWRVPARYKHVTVTRHGGVIVYLDNPSGQDTAQVLNLLTNQPYPGLALELVHERPDGLLEGYSAADVTRYLFTVHGEILARVPVPVPPGSALANGDVVPASRIGPAPCAFHAYKRESGDNKAEAAADATP